MSLSLSLRAFASLLLVFLFSCPGHAFGKTWRVLYVEGGPYTNYQQTLAYTARGLARLGLIQNGDVPIPQETEDTGTMWKWLSENAGGDTLYFLPDGHYSAEWDANARLKVKNAIKSRIWNKQDVDMIIAMGTWSGLDMTEEDLGVPVFSMSVTDAVAAGIVDSVKDSGKDNVHAQLEPGRFRRQITMFHEIFRFKKLGVPYEDTPEGRQTAAMDEIEQTARDLGIELVTCTAPLDLPDGDQVFENLQSCISTLSKQVDALYLTYNSLPMERMPELIEPLIRAGIPSFAQAGPEAVGYGVLMSLAQASFRDMGQFEADSIAAVVSGKKPRDINQVFEPELGLAINLKTAMRIGWNPPLEILAAVDEIYQQIPVVSR